MPRPTMAPPVTHFELDLGDTTFLVQEHADGLFTIEQPDPKLVLAPEHMRAIVQGLAAIGKAKGWLDPIIGDAVAEVQLEKDLESMEQPEP